MKHLSPSAVKYTDGTYPKTIETTISIGHIKDLIEDELRRNNWIKNDEDLVAMSFGPIPKPWAKDTTTKINAYLNLTMPLHYTLNKQERKQPEIKVRVYE